jgi:hypothetical protein
MAFRKKIEEEKKKVEESESSLHRPQDLNELTTAAVKAEMFSDKKQRNRDKDE